MRSRESFNELEVGFGELVGVQIGPIHPSKLCNIDRVRLTIEDSAVEEVQLDGLRRIVMRGGVVLVVDFDIDAEFLA